MIMFFFFLKEQASSQKKQGIYYKRIHFQLELIQRDNIQFSGTVSFLGFINSLWTIYGEMRFVQYKMNHLY